MKNHNALKAQLAVLYHNTEFITHLYALFCFIVYVCVKQICI